MSRLPSLNGLHAFEVAGRRLSFRAAAEELGVTQGAVAQHVRQLEAHLGITLFERLPKGLALTPSGHSYHSAIAPAFATLRTATRQLRPAPGKVLISATPSFAAKWLIPNLPDLAQKCPDIDLRLMATEKISSFHSDGVDLAIRQGHPPFGAALRARLLFKHDLIAVAAPALVRANPTRTRLEHLSELPKIHDTHNLWPKVLAELGIPDPGGQGLRLNQTALAVDAALSGQGVALVSRFLVTREIAAGHLTELGHAPTAGKQDFYLLTPGTPRQGSATARVVDWLVSRAAETR